MKLELHCHSTCSDGSFAARTVAHRAYDYGVELFCLTDHDTFAGYHDTVDALDGRPVRVLRGTELSCKANGRTVHLLLYGLTEGPGLDALTQRTQRLHETRTHRLRLICAKLAKLGHSLDPDAILAQTHGVPGRPAVAKALVAAGICSSFKEAFARFLRDGGPADVAVDRLSLREGLELGLAAGGRASLAHPHAYGEYPLVQSLCRQYRDHGLGGIEALYGAYGHAQQHAWLRLADELELVATGGSDFHGEATPAISRPGIEVESDRAQKLCAWLLER